MTTISVIGCGWFGLPLAKNLVDLGHEVVGTTTHREKLPDIQCIGAKGVLLKISESGFEGDISEILNSDIFVINLPPGRHTNQTESYFNKIQILRNHIPAQKKIIFISSTSVYQNTNGLTNESVLCQPESASGKVLLQAEKLIGGPNSTILRFAGLIGPNRKPGRFLAGKKDIPNGKAPINLVQLRDCINICIEIIEQEIWGELFNVCSSQHPEKQDFYTAAALQLNLEAPEFIDELQSFKIIDNSKIKAKLNYEFLDLVMA